MTNKVDELKFELAKAVRELVFEQIQKSATNYYRWIDKKCRCSFTWKMLRLVKEVEVKEESTSNWVKLKTSNAKRVMGFIDGNKWVLGYTQEEISCMQENKDYTLKSPLLSLEEIAAAKKELSDYYTCVFVWGNGAKRDNKPFREILRDMDNFEKAYREKYSEFLRLNEAIMKCEAC
ncbi:hypothetical protein BB390_06920 [Helicobacter pylori]|uniref:hypothetical protein n=1 Tax=Helicobacter pylori TaxID=210 RepID=UPI000BE7A318|nr:hypothetical protein [Helicobacter pylori]PDW12441.1 hypothetical protein BB390_06920 [Helicobacter pylori]